jgi:hypothetical protein
MSTTPPRLRDRVRELRALVDEVAPPGWTTSPVWWALIGAVAAVEPFGRPGAYVVSNAEPRADTFMGVPGPGPDDAAGRIGWAIAAAHAAVRAVLARDGTLPDQPLTVGIALHRGAARAVPIASPWRVAFAIGSGVVTALLDPRGPAHEAELARTLAAALHTPPRAVRDDEPTPMLTVTVGDDDLAHAHHGHRRAWHARGGPWLGVARAGGLTVVSTCHMIVDGWGHAMLTADITRGLDRTAMRTLAAAANLSNLTNFPPSPLTDGDGGKFVKFDKIGSAIGVAWRRLPAPLPPFMRQAYALGRLLHRDRGEARATRSPTFQIPVAPGAADDPSRFARRVRPAIVSVRFADGRAEPEAAFAARARAAIAREAQGRGLTSHLLTALSALPAPLGWKRGVVGARARWLADAIDVIAGTGCLSYMRAAGVPPLVAVSSPAQLLPDTARAATSVLTVIADGDGATVTLAGSGRAASAAECEALLDAWCTDVATAATDARPMLG